MFPVDQGVTAHLSVSAARGCAGAMAHWQVTRRTCVPPLFSFEVKDSCHPNKPRRTRFAFLACHSPAPGKLAASGAARSYKGVMELATRSYSCTCFILFVGKILRPLVTRRTTMGGKMLLGEVFVRVVLQTSPRIILWGGERNGMPLPCSWKRPGKAPS